MGKSSKEINDLIKSESADGLKAGQISDGYHTFDELYEHRIAIFIALCKLLIFKYNNLHGEYSTPADRNPVWRSQLHSDGTKWDGWFILGIFTKAGQQITYHLPMDKWDYCGFANDLSQAPPFDGHTSQDVLDRISKL